MSGNWVRGMNRPWRPGWGPPSCPRPSSLPRLPISWLICLLLWSAAIAGALSIACPSSMACSFVPLPYRSHDFVPLLGYYLLRPPKTLEAPIAGAQHWLSGALLQFWCLKPIWRIAGVFPDGRLPAFPAAGRFCDVESAYRLLSQGPFLSLLCDVWLPEDAPGSGYLMSTTGSSRSCSEQAAADYGRSILGNYGKPRKKPDRGFFFFFFFFFSLAPEPRQKTTTPKSSSKVKDKHDTSHLATPLQQARLVRFPEPG